MIALPIIMIPMSLLQSSIVILSIFLLSASVKSKLQMSKSYLHDPNISMPVNACLQHQMHFFLSILTFIVQTNHRLFFTCNHNNSKDKLNCVFLFIDFKISHLIPVHAHTYSIFSKGIFAVSIWAITGEESVGSLNANRIYSVIQLIRKKSMTCANQTPLKKSHNSDTFDSLDYEENSVLQKYAKYVFKPEPNDLPLTPEKTCQKIVHWALEHEVDHYSFLSFPHNAAACEKQESLIDLKYIFDHGLVGQPRLHLPTELLLKGEADGSSFPSGGLRTTHRARAYNVWDRANDIFIRRKNKVMYIPSMLVAHNGEALDDMTIYRKSEAVMKQAASEMLTALGIQHQDVFLALGLEQQFFVVPKNAYLQRHDLRMTGRCLFGRVGAKNQQFSDHYYAKMPFKIEEILKEVEGELLEVGIPFKTKHNEVANNQFQFCAIYDQAGKSIFQNLVIMQILKETFDRHGYTVLLHEKPFLGLNGSGKHANWSINYAKPNGQMCNMFAVPTTEDTQLFKLFVLLTLMALKRNNALYFGAIAPPGNQVRLGGHEAPPRIISAYLGQAVGSIIDGKHPQPKKNLKTEIFCLPHDVYQEDTDRNRTSPYAYTGNKFEFRALGSSQNPAFPMAVIAATLAKEFKIATEKIQNGSTCTQLIEELRIESQAVRFEGNGYSHEWAVEAKARGLYVNTEFVDILERMKEECRVFTEVKACSEQQINARCQSAKENYLLTVGAQAKALLHTATQCVVPRAYAYFNILNVKSEFAAISKFSNRFGVIFNEVLSELAEMEEQIQSSSSLKEASNLRIKVRQCGEKLGKLCGYLQKRDSLPDLEDFLLM